MKVFRTDPDIHQLDQPSPYDTDMTGQAARRGPPLPDELALAQREMSRLTGELAAHCDHVDHNEVTDLKTVIAAGQRLRSLALFLASAAAADPFELYADRLRRLEAKTVFGPDPRHDTSAEVRAARSWRDLQVAQVEHDRYYHPDVFMLPRAEHLKHILIHLAKLSGHLAGLDPHDKSQWSAFVSRRLPDMLIFGLKIPTVVCERLPDDPLPVVPSLERDRRKSMATDEVVSGKTGARS